MPLPPPASWAEWAQISEAVAVIATLLYMVAQASDLRKTLKTQLYASFNRDMLEVRRALVDNADVAPYFLWGIPIAENHDSQMYSKAVAVGDFLLDFFGSVMVGRIQGLEKVYEDEWWDSYFRASFKNSPLLCERFPIVFTTKTRYRKMLADLMDQGVKDRREGLA